MKGNLSYVNNKIHVRKKSLPYFYEPGSYYEEKQ